MLRNNAHDKEGDSHTYCTCLGQLGQHDTDRIVSIYVAMTKVAKATTVSLRCRWQQSQHYRITFANVNTALRLIIDIYRIY